MTTWHRPAPDGTPISFSYAVDERNNVTLTREEVEGLLSTGGWDPEPPPPTLEDIAASLNAFGRALGHCPPTRGNRAHEGGHQ